MSRSGWDYPEERERFSAVGDIDGRLSFFRVIIIVIFGLLLYRVYYIQKNRGQELIQLAQENQ